MHQNNIESNYSAVLTQNYSSVDVQPPLPQIYCDHSKIIKFRSHKYGNILKRNCSQCGCFIAQVRYYQILSLKNGLTTVKELGQNFEADTSPIEQYENILDDEQFMSFHHLYQTHVITMTDQDRADLNSLRSCNIEKIFLYGEKLRQSPLTIHLACAYYDYLLFKIFIQDLQQRSQQDPFHQRNSSRTHQNSSMVQGSSSLLNDKHRIRKLSLKAQMCLLLASKFDELDDRIPMIRDFQKLSRYEFAYKECKDEEEVVLNQLNWSLNFITPMNVLQCMQAMGTVFEDDRLQSETDLQNTFPINDNVIRQVRKRAEYFADLSIKQDWGFQLYTPSLVGLACVLASRFENKVVPMWNEKFFEMTGYKMDPYNELFECFEKLYSSHDSNYKSIKLTMFGNIKTHKSLLSTCEPNCQSNDDISIHKQSTRKSNILEQNQNITNETQKVLKGAGDIQDSNLINFEYNYEIDLGDESMLSKKLIDHIPSLQQSNKQSHILFNNAPSVNQSCSQRSSVSTLNLQKHTTSNQTKQSVVRDSQKLLSKKKSDISKVNKENQSQVSSSQQQQSSKQTSKSKPVQKSCRISSNPGNKFEDQPIKLQSIESTKNFNSSQLLSIPVTRCTSNISHVNQLNSTSNSNTQQKGVNGQFKQRNQSASNLHQQQNVISHHQSHHGSIPQKSMIKLNVITQKIQSHQNQMQQNNGQNIKIPQLSTINQNLSNQIVNRISTLKSQNASRSRKQSVCSGSSLTRYQYNSKVQKQNQNSSQSIINQKLKAHQSQESIIKVDAKVFASKSNRQSTCNVLIDLSRPMRESSSKNRKMSELVQKYQSENTIYEKSMFNGGRNSNMSMLGGFQAHSKTFAALHHTLNINHNTSIERPQSECDNSKIIKKGKRDSQIFSSQAYLNSKLQKSSDKLQFQTIQEPRKNRNAIMEEENEAEKSNVEFDQTQLQINFDEYQVAEDDSVIIKRPMSSKKSKSLENVNKVVKSRKASVTSKAIIELYKKQYQQQNISQCETRNYTVQQPTKVTTVDMSYQDNNINVSCQQNRGQKSTSNGPNKTNYIKKNINFISLLNNNAFLSLENSQVENHQYRDNNKQGLRDSSNTHSYRGNSRCSMYPQHLLSQNHSNNSKHIQIAQQSDSQRRRFGKYNQLNNSITQNHSLNSRIQQNQSKSSLPSNRILNQNKSQAMFLDERRSQEIKNNNNNSDYFVINPETTLGEIDQDQTIEIEKYDNKGNSQVRSVQQQNNNMSASSSQIHLKERPYHRFLNQNNKQNFQDFSKNFKEKSKKSPVQNQIHKMKFETIKIKIISPKGIEEKSPVIQQLKSQQFITKNENHLKASRRTSNQSMNIEIQPNSGRPQLSHRSNQSNSNNDKSYHILSTSSTQNLIKYHKFQTRKPVKQSTNHSLIEQALLKKSKLHSILKPFDSYQVGQTLDNTYETTFDEKNSSYNNVQNVPPSSIQNIQKNQSSNNRGSIMIPMLNNNTNQLQVVANKNQSLLNIKSPQNVIVQTVTTQQDIPPAQGCQNQKYFKQSQVLKSSNKLQKSIEKNFPTIQAPVSARVSNKFNVNQHNNITSSSSSHNIMVLNTNIDLTQKEQVIQEEDEYRHISVLFKKAQGTSYKYNK